MPSPLGHAIAGVAAGWLVVGAPNRLRQPHPLKQVALFAGLGMLPDLDLLFGIHSGPTHSIGASAAIGVVAFALAAVRSSPRRGRLALACMGAYAHRLDPAQVDRWVVCGLLHDFDYERHPNSSEHPFVGVKELERRGVDVEIRTAILGHADYSGVPRESAMARALYACDELSGFIVACAKVRPNGDR